MAGAFDWIFPIVGQNKWNKGSWMPTTKTHRGRTHAAIDIYADRGAFIVSPVSGTVDASGTGEIGGNYVRIIGDDGIIYYFAHMDSKSHLKTGQRIERAALVGYVGNSGSATTTSTHLHFSMRQAGSNVPVNPSQYLTDGYRIDGPIGTQYDPNQMVGGDTSILVPYNPDTFEYATAEEVVGRVLGEEEPPPNATASEILGGTMAHVANLIAGGERMDYRGLGMTGIAKSQLHLMANLAGEEVDITPTETEGADGLQVKEVGQVAAVEEVPGG